MDRIYVETVVRAPLDAVWAATQDPAAHQRWDARFTTIERAPAGPDGLRRFGYSTTLLPGLHIGGIGVYAAERVSPTTATSALRFAGTHPLALIGTGSGYWRYRQTTDGVQFLTGYDYRPAWGRLGRIADIAFRPLIGWATAWSFDRLRLWLEHGVRPEVALGRAIATTAVRLLAIAGAVALGARVAVPVTALALYLTPVPFVSAALRCRRHPQRLEPR